jgi:hypothetical protein
MVNFVKYSLILLSIIIGGHVFAKTNNIIVSTSTHIDNGDWYPISQKEMQASAVNTALGELTKTGDFFINENANNGNIIDFDIALVGPVEIIRLTITLTVKDRGTLVSSVSQKISDLDRQGIYESFEYVGKEAAMQMYEKLQLNPQLKNNPILPIAPIVIKPAPTIAVKPIPVKIKTEQLTNQDIKPYILNILSELRRINSAELQVNNGKTNSVKKDSIPFESNSTFLAIFNEAQRLKRKHEYRKARALFEEIITNNKNSNDKTVLLAVDELIYGIPKFQVSSIKLSLSASTTPEQTNNKFFEINALLREMLANNSNNIERTLLINQELDDVTISREALSRVFEGQALVSISPLKINLIMMFQMQGEWPNENTISELLERMTSDISIKAYKVKQGVLNLSLYNKKFRKVIHIIGNKNGQIELMSNK